MEQRENRLSIILRGLNVLYSVDAFNNFITNQSDMEENPLYSITNSSLITYQDLASSLLRKYPGLKSHSSEISFEDYEIEFKLMLSKKGDDIGNHIVKDWFQICSISKLLSIKDKYKLIISHINPLHMLLDKIILELFNVAEHFCFMLKDTVYYEILKKPNNFIICDFDVKYLLRFHEMGCWTVYLTCLYLNHTEHNQIIKPLLLSNEALLSSTSNFPSICSISFYNQEFYYCVIKEIVDSNTNKKNASENALLHYKMRELNQLRVFVIMSILIKPFAFNKSSFHISNKDIQYIFYKGNIDDLRDNNSFHLASIRFNEIQSLTYYKEIVDVLNGLDQKKVVNSISKAEIVLNRKLLTKALLNFNKEFIAKYSKSGQNHVPFPSGNYYESLNKCEFELGYKNKININISFFKANPEEVEKHVKEQFNYLFFIKFNSKTNINYNHKIVLVCNQTGFKSAYEEVSNYNSQDLELILESLLLHDNEVIKAFHIADKVHIFTRPSIPSNLIEIIGNEGYLSFYTKDLENKAFRQKIGFDDLNKLSSLSIQSNKKQQMIRSSKPSLSENEVLFIELILKNIKEFFNLNLFGVDLILSDKKYFIIDINYFPAYSELKDVISQELTMHYSLEHNYRYTQLN